MGHCHIIIVKNIWLYGFFCCVWMILFHWNSYSLVDCNKCLFDQYLFVIVAACIYRLCFMPKHFHCLSTTKNDIRHMSDWNMSDRSIDWYINGNSLMMWWTRQYLLFFLKEFYISKKKFPRIFDIAMFVFFGRFICQPEDNLQGKYY